MSPRSALDPAASRLRRSLSTGLTAASMTASTARLNLRVLATLTAGVALVLGLMSAAPASAHSNLEASSPENGASVSDVSEVSLTFGEEIVPDYTTLSLTNANADPVDLAPPTMDATNTIVAARVATAPLPDGAYSLAYYIVSIDGHPIEGTVSFTVEGSPAPAPTPTEVAPTESTAPVVTPTESPIPVDGEVRLLTTSSGAPDLTWVWVGTGIAAVVVLGAVSAVLLIALRRRRDDDSTP